MDIALDQLTLGEFHLLQNGEALPVSLGGLAATFAAGQDSALGIASLRVGHEIGQAELSGEAELRAGGPVAVQPAAGRGRAGRRP